MKQISAILFLAVVFSLLGVNLYAQKVKAYLPVTIEKSSKLQKTVDRAVAQTLQKFADKGFKQENIAVTLIDLRNPSHLISGEFRGEEKIYPASVVKMFSMLLFVNGSKMEN